jgi:hypothetical protein
VGSNPTPRTLKSTFASFTSSLSGSRFSGHSGASILFQIALVVYLVVGIVITLVQGQADFFAVASLIFAVPYLAFIWFGLKGKPWSFLASSILGALLLVATSLSAPIATTPVLAYETNLAAVLFLLISIEGFVAYSEAKVHK